MSKLQRSQYRVLDEATRSRRVRRQLEQLEKDNFHDDPHANLVMHKKAPKFEDNSIKMDSMGSSGNSSASSSMFSSKRHSHRPKTIAFGTLIEEDAKLRQGAYVNAVAPSPEHLSFDRIKFPVPSKRNFCCVCGFSSPYTCVACGMRYCSATCLKTHQDTRCLKWTV